VRHNTKMRCMGISPVNSINATGQGRYTHDKCDMSVSDFCSSATRCYLTSNVIKEGIHTDVHVSLSHTHTHAHTSKSTIFVKVSSSNKLYSRNKISYFLTN
jgi:hypothetical protein